MTTDTPGDGDLRVVVWRSLAYLRMLPDDEYVRGQGVAEIISAMSGLVLLWWVVRVWVRAGTGAVSPAKSWNEDSFLEEYGVPDRCS